MKKLKGLASLIKEGNDCYKCPCLWEDVGFEDSDCGCYAGRDYFEEICWLPLIVRKYLARRAKFFADHEYDGIEEWCDKEDRTQRAARQAVYYGNRHSMVFCWRYKKEDGSFDLAEYNQQSVLNSMCYDIRRAVEDELRKGKPQNLKEEWIALVKKTAKDGIFKVRSILTI